MPTAKDSALTPPHAPPSSDQPHGSCERLELDPQTPWWGEHRCRYRFALPHVNGQRVLDIACGTGFGAVMLTTAGATTVVGIDVDTATVQGAQREHGNKHRLFMQADGTKLPFNAATFNVVTSFETLEHIPQADTFLSELRRVLDATGTLVLSTPNRAYTELNGQKCDNPFHVREYTRPELETMLRHHFSEVELFGQRLAPEYKISPFVYDQRRQVMNASQKLRLLLWKVQNKLPFSLKDRLSRLVSGHPFYPDEAHYLFTSEKIDSAPVLVAVCHP